MARNCSSKPQWAHLEYCWKLEKFWELRALASIEALEEDSGDVVWSPRFGDKKRGLWRLKVYPYGDASPAGRGHVSVFLALDTKATATSKTYAIFGCYVLDEQGNKIQGSGRSFTRQKFAEGSASWGWSQFVKSDDQALMGMLVDDTLTLKCDIDIFIGVKCTHGKYSQQQLLLKDELFDYLQNDRSKDIQLKVKNSKVWINRTLLCARSLTFCKLLTPSIITSEAVGEVSRHETTTTTTTTSDVFSNGTQEKLEYHYHPATFSTNTNKGDDKKTNIAIAKPLNPLFSDPKEFVTISIVHEEHGDESNECLSTPNIFDQTLILELIHPDVSLYAVQQMVEYMLNDTCEIFTEISPAIAIILEVFIISCVYNVQSLRSACIEILISRITAKSDAKLILAVADKFGCETLINECHTFLQYFTPELQGAELMRLLLPTATPSSITRVNSSPSSRASTRVG